MTLGEPSSESREERGRVLQSAAGRADAGTVGVRLPSGRVLDFMFILSCFVLNLYLSTHYLSGAVFDSERIRMQGRDSWYHMRLVDHLVHNFPQRITFDPLAVFPAGQAVAAAPGLDFLIAGIALVVGGGEPSARLVDTVGAWVPPLLGAFTLVPVWVIARVLFGRIAALLAVALLSVAPGEFFLRTTLGFADHHGGEILFSATTVALIVLALRRRAAQSKPTRSVGLSMMAGLSMATYLFIWSGGAFLVLALSAWLLLQLTVDVARRANDDLTTAAVAPALSVAALSVWAASASLARADVQLAALGLGLGISVLCMVARDRARSSRFRLSPSLAAGATIGLVALVYAGLGTQRLASEIARLWPDASMLTIVEARPLLWQGEAFSLGPGWREFGPSFALLPVGLWGLARRFVRDGRPEDGLFVVWSVTVALATLYQIRFAYYLAVTVAILAGYVLKRLIGWAWASSESRWRDFSRRIAVAGIVAAAWLGNAAQAAGRAGEDHGPPIAWEEALEWLRDNTEPAFADPGFYLESYPQPAAGSAYRPPADHYGVMNWWDHGWWTLRIGRRIPISNPNGSGITSAARFFLSSTVEEANEVMNSTRGRYIAVDEQLVVRQVGNALVGKFDALPRWLDREPTEFREVYWRRMNDGELAAVLFYYPAFHRTAVARLFLHGARSVTPDFDTWVIRYAERTGTLGKRYKELLSSKPFTEYEDAVAFVEARPTDLLRVVGFEPHVSCVPLEEFTGYSLVYESKRRGGVAGLPPVRIFEYRPRPTEGADAS